MCYNRIDLSKGIYLTKNKSSKGFIVSQISKIRLKWLLWFDDFVSVQSNLRKMLSLHYYKLMENWRTWSKKTFNEWWLYAS